MERRKSTKLLAEIGIVVLVLLFLLLPGLLRENDLPIGDKPYYHLRMAEGGEDGLSFSGRNNVNAIGWNFLLKWIPLNVLLGVMGVVSLILFFLILKPLSLTEKLMSMGFFIVSPAFIYLFNVGERFGIGILFSLLVFYFLINEKNILAGVSLLFIFSFDFGMALFVLFLGLSWFLYKKKVVFSTLMFLFLLFVLLFGEWKGNFISDLGALIGVSIFALFFIIFCLILFWNKKKFLPLYGVLLGLFLSSLKLEFGIFYFSLFLSVLMALCFVELYKMKWESKLIRDLTLLLVVCSLLFSGLSYTNRLSQELPNGDIFEALEELPSGSVVFSEIGYGHWISFSGKKNVWDSFTNVPNFKERKKDFERLKGLRDPFEVKKILDKYEIDYILMDKNLRSLWGGEGLLYLLKYNDESFKKITKDEEIEIWRYYKWV